ncbi:hypothetical protein ACFWDK_20915 [Micromonospora chalcea]|uniref:hypothetical protein n=1 Tax=Micromonospora sp. TSRI0369 TaxID=1703936 RepID=UPI000ADC6F7A|nr:hypothetical protein [Micromonospora sp. TSRI0369]
MSTATRERRNEEHGTPRDERTVVVTALRLGWSMADAYHHAQNADLTDGGNRPVAAPPKLSNLTELAGWHRLGMYLDGVDVALAQIAPLTPAGRTAPSTAAARRATGPDREPLLRALDDLNIDVLRWTMATNHRVGVAYRLGRSLADTVRRGDADRAAGGGGRQRRRGGRVPHHPGGGGARRPRRRAHSDLAVDLHADAVGGRRGEPPAAGQRAGGADDRPDRPPARRGPKRRTGRTAAEARRRRIEIRCPGFPNRSTVTTQGQPPLREPSMSLRSATTMTSWPLGDGCREHGPWPGEHD